MTTEMITKAVSEVAAAQKAHAAKLTEQLESVATRQAELADRLTGLEQKGGSLPSERQAPASFVAKFMQSEQLRAVANGAPSTGRFEVKASLPEVRKALLSYQGAETNTNQYNVQAQRDFGLYADPRLALALLELLPRVQVNSNAYEYVRLHSSFTHAATFQTYESDAKAEQSVPTSLVSSPIKAARPRPSLFFGALVISMSRPANLYMFRGRIAHAARSSRSRRMISEASLI